MCIGESLYVFEVLNLWRVLCLGLKGKGEDRWTTVISMWASEDTNISTTWSRHRTKKMVQNNVLRGEVFMQGVYSQKYNETSTQKKLERDSMLIQRSWNAAWQERTQFCWHGRAAILLKASYFEQLLNCFFNNCLDIINYSKEKSPQNMGHV